MRQMKKQKTKVELSKLDEVRLIVKKCNDALGDEGKVYLGGDHPQVERIPTDVLALDILLGGGLPRAQLTEFYGEASSGKTLSALLSTAAVQRRGGVAVWLKGEGFDVPWAMANGVDVAKLIVVESSTGDTALETALTLLESGLVDLLVIDSYQSLGTTREQEGGIESEAYGNAGAPQMWGRVMRRAYAAANTGKSNAAIIGISQVRAPIGKWSPQGTPEAEPTQIKALLHWKGISIGFRKGEPFWTDPKSEKRRIYAREFKLKVAKNKTAGTEGMVGSFNYHFREHDGVKKGVDLVRSVYVLGKAYGLLEQRGAWTEGYGLRAQGEEGFLGLLRKHPSTVKELATDILDAAKS